MELGRIFWSSRYLLEGDAASHDGGQLHVIHGIAAGVGSEILFHGLFGDPANAGD